MEKLMVKICTGTLCYVMGGAELQLLDESLPAELLARVEIQGSPCLGFCNSSESSQAPYVMVGSTKIAQANVSKVIDEIKSQLDGGK